MVFVKKPKFTEKLKVLIVRSEFNRVITNSLLDGAIEYLIEAGIQDTNITTFNVLGAVEVPVVLKRELSSLNFGEELSYDMAIAIGAVIRGTTPHFDYVCEMVTTGIQRVMLEYTVPVGFGILTLNDFEQAIKRCGRGKDNKGREAAEAALRIVN